MKKLRIVLSAIALTTLCAFGEPRCGIGTSPSEPAVKPEGGVIISRPEGGVVVTAQAPETGVIVMGR